MRSTGWRKELSGGRQDERHALYDLQKEFGGVQDLCLGHVGQAPSHVSRQPIGAPSFGAVDDGLDLIQLHAFLHLV